MRLCVTWRRGSKNANTSFVTQVQGSMSHRRVAERAAFERAHYLRTVGTFSLASSLAVNETSSTYGIEATPGPPSD